MSTSHEHQFVLTKLSQRVTERFCDWTSSASSLSSAAVPLSFSPLQFSTETWLKEKLEAVAGPCNFFHLLWRWNRLQNVEDLLHAFAASFRIFSQKGKNRDLVLLYLWNRIRGSVNDGLMGISCELCLTRPRKWVWRTRTVTRRGHKQRWLQRRSLPASTRSWWTSAGTGWIFSLECPTAPLPWGWRRTKRTLIHWKCILAGWLSFCLEEFIWQEDSAVCHLTGTSPQHQPVAGNTELIRFVRETEGASSNSEAEVLKWWHQAGSVDSRTLGPKHWLRVWIWPPDTAHQGWIHHKGGMSLCNCMCER